MHVEFVYDFFFTCTSTEMYTFCLVLSVFEVLRIQSGVSTKFQNHDLHCAKHVDHVHICTRVMCDVENKKHKITTFITHESCKLTLTCTVQNKNSERDFIRNIASECRQYRNSVARANGSFLIFCCEQLFSYFIRLRATVLLCKSCKLLQVMYVSLHVQIDMYIAV